jgi:hypothetical protein
VHSYQTAYWWGAGAFALGGVIAVLLFRRRGQGLSLSHVPAVVPTDARDEEPVLAH